MWRHYIGALIHNDYITLYLNKSTNKSPPTLSKTAEVEVSSFKGKDYAERLYSLGEIFAFYLTENDSS